MSNKLKRMKELIAILNEASKAYYAQDKEIISNFEYDKLYDELVALEKELELVLTNSPTNKVGYEVLDYLPKEEHISKMLSLDKTKDSEVLKEWLGDKEGLLSFKLDGLTIVLTYTDGKLSKAVTRGNGEVGEVITNNARVMQNIPLFIPYNGKLTIRGEAVISYSNFEIINNSIESEDEKYKNPRNLCSGSIRQLNNAYTADRMVDFHAFSLVDIDREFSTREEQMLLLRSYGFDIVEYKKVTSDTILEEIESFSKKVQTYDIPSDGLVLCYNDIAYGKSLGSTAKFPKDAMAFKWQDEIKETKLLEIEWSPSRTGLINPVAIFEPVELEGTTVSRASVHNISIVRELELGLGDTIEVYKANMIIPQIAQNLTRSNSLVIPLNCPNCGGKTQIKETQGAKTLYCMNEECSAKKIKSFTLFVSRNALNIEGLSEATLEKFIQRGYIKNFTDIFKLDKYREDIIELEGFGEKSYNNLIKSIDNVKKTTLSRVIYSLGIANVGVNTAKIIAKFLNNDPFKLIDTDIKSLSEIDGIGEVIASSIIDYIANVANKGAYIELVGELEFEKVVISQKNMILAGKVFVITGSLNSYENRDALKNEIEELGGKVTGSVTSKTNYLINNDSLSSSSKNKKAKELGVTIITEKEYKKMII